MTHLTSLLKNKLLLQKNYEVFGISRTNCSNPNIINYKGDVTDINFIYKTIINCMPDEIYHLAAMAYNEDYWNDPINNYFKPHLMGLLY